MPWDNYYDWRGLLLISSWIKGMAIALWVPALMAATGSALVKRGVMGRLPAAALYVVAAGGWSLILLTIPNMNTWAPMWIPGAQLMTVPLSLVGFAIVLSTPVPAGIGPRGFDVILRQSDVTDGDMRRGENDNRLK